MTIQEVADSLDRLGPGASFTIEQDPGVGGLVFRVRVERDGTRVEARHALTPTEIQTARFPIVSRAVWHVFCLMHEVLRQPPETRE